MKSIFAAIAAFSLTVFGAGAQAQDVINNASGIIPSVSLSDIEPVLKEVGFETEIKTINNESLMVVRALGKTLVMFPKACQPDGSCAGLWMFAYLNGTSSLEAVNSFNQVAKPARASMVNNKVVLDRYLIADYGITRGSFIINVGVMAGMVDQWFQYSKIQGPVAVSFEPLIGPSDSESASSVGHKDLDMLRSLSVDAGLSNAPADADTMLN
ncbi:MAG: hypothetical protein ACWA5T_03115 [Parvularcula sp.]